MTKLSYTNRKSEGVKLGLIVAKDLRKRTKPSPATKADLHKDASVLEIHVDGKDLTDDGLVELTEGLRDALASDCNGSFSRLHVLNLSGNRLTVASLAALAPCIRLAVVDLEDLDLSGNEIAVKSDPDLLNWKTFLDAFENCTTLKRLNLSGNDLSGSRAFEGFAYCFAKDSRHLLEQLRDDDSILSESGLENGDLVDGNPPLSDITNGSSTSPPHSTLKPQGLASIPVILLNEVSMTDAGALFLSYAISQRRSVINLPSPAFALLRNTPNVSVLGFVVEPNEGLTEVGIKLLKNADAVPDALGLATSTNHDESPSMRRNSTVTAAHAAKRNAGTGVPRKQHSESAQLAESMAKVSINHTHTAAENLVSGRRKIQRTILESSGAGSIELWAAALKLLSYARWTMIGVPDLNVRQQPKTRHSPERSMEKRASPTKPLQQIQQTWASKLAADQLPKNGPTRSALQEATFLSTPQILRHSTSTSLRGSSVSTASSSPMTFYSSQSTVSTPSKTTDSPCRAAKLGLKHIAGLPVNIWERIICLAADPDELLSDKQRRAIIDWGRDEKTLAAEVESIGKPSSVQAWRVLEAMGCLAYDDEP